MENSVCWEQPKEEWMEAITSIVNVMNTIDDGPSSSLNITYDSYHLRYKILSSITSYLVSYLYTR